MKLITAKPVAAGRNNAAKERHAGQAGTSTAINAPIPPVEVPTDLFFILHVFTLKLYTCNVRSKPNKVENIISRNKFIVGITLNHKSKFCNPPVAIDCDMGKNNNIKSEEVIIKARFFLFLRILKTLSSLNLKFFSIYFFECTL